VNSELTVRRPETNAMKWGIAALLALSLPVIWVGTQHLSRSHGFGNQGHPNGVAVSESDLGPVYVDSHGKTLYAMNTHMTRFRTGEALKYCAGLCARVWTPLQPRSWSRPTGHWTIVEGAQGQQWAFKGDPVFTYAADQRPGSTAGEGYEDLWQALRYVPPAPTVAAPANVGPLFVDGSYILADHEGRALYTNQFAGECAAKCATWSPLLAGMASQPVGEWQVSMQGDRPQWTYRGNSVFVSHDEDRTRVPAETAILRP